MKDSTLRNIFLSPPIRKIYIAYICLGSKALAVCERGLVYIFTHLCLYYGSITSFTFGWHWKHWTNVCKSQKLNVRFTSLHGHCLFVDYHVTNLLTTAKRKREDVNLQSKFHKHHDKGQPLYFIVYILMDVFFFVSVFQYDLMCL